MDVAQVLANLMGISQLPGTLSLPGPRTLSFEYLLDLVSAVTYNPPSRAPVLPKRMALAVAKAAQAAWWPLISPDEVERRYLDDVSVPGDWDAVGVIPDEIENHAISYLRRYRSAYVPLDTSLFVVALIPDSAMQRQLPTPSSFAVKANLGESFPMFANA
jgi:NADH dehydrogenase (ubiquinone) 1 alpha subcomplex subunit 9